MITKRHEDGRVECRCQCGLTFVSTEEAITSGTVKHCGCLDKPGVAPALKLPKPAKK